MRLLMKSNFFSKLAKCLPLFTSFYFVNNLIAFGMENKSDYLKNKKIDSSFEDIYFQNSIPYTEYDNLESQIKTFTGKSYLDNNKHNYYPDLSIIKDSEAIREMYHSKLNDMTTKKFINNIKNELPSRN